MFYQCFLTRFSRLSEHSFFTKRILANKSIILKLIRLCYTAVEGDKASLNPKEQNSKKKSHFSGVYTSRKTNRLRRYLCSVLENRYKTASTTEEHDCFTTNSSMADKTTVDNPEVGTLDSFLSQNTAENTVENTGQNEINSTKPDKASPETDENTLSVSTNDPSSRPKRSVKPTEKSIENRVQSDHSKLDKLWRNTSTAVGKLKETPDSLHQIKSHTSEVRSLFNEYHTVSLSLLEFLANLSDPKHQKEYETLQKLVNNRSEYIHTVINEANERKKELLLEMNSVHHSRISRSSRRSATSSTAARALARAEATAALKKVEMQKWRSLRESQSAMEIQQQELALAQKKMEEKSRMESLRLEEEAAVAVAKAQAIDKELSLVDHQDPEHFDLP